MVTSAQRSFIKLEEQKHAGSGLVCFTVKTFRKCDNIENKNLIALEKNFKYVSTKIIDADN